MSSMTVCTTDTSIVPFPSLDSARAQTSNTASNPLPYIPCRNARSNPLAISDLSTPHPSISNSSEPAIYPHQSRPATYVRYDSGSSSSSSTLSDEIRPTIIPRSKRVPSSSRDFIAPATPASTPVKPRSDGRLSADLECRKQTPLRDASDDEDFVRPFLVLRKPPIGKVGKLRLEGSAGKHGCRPSDSTHRAPAVATPTSNQPPQTIRKKSGQPVKSSLKNTRRPELHVITGGSLAKSEPVTPTHAKAVHFDSKLEHVKLFLAEQKPLAVSRDGSPTSDTSGDEFPSFIYGDRDNHNVKMLVPNMPSPPRKDENVALQGLALSHEQRTITGTVRVRNIAYEKWLAVRFTLDWWQTTSEVTARYERSIEGGAFDEFTFSIRLHDFWSRIEEKTIFIALRYAVSGQEYWDNNAGKNYHIKFVSGPSSEPSSAVDNEASLKDLKLRLEDLAKARSPPVPIPSYRLGRSFSADQCSSLVKSSGRYNFTSAHKTKWAGDTSPLPSRHTRNHTYPSGVLTTTHPIAVPWSNSLTTPESDEVPTPPRPQSPATLPCAGSPWMAIDSIPTSPASSETTVAPPDSPSLLYSQDGKGRNHHRSYMECAKEGSPAMRRTPPGSPLRFTSTSKDELPRVWSYPITSQKLGSTESLPRQQQSAFKPPLSIQIAPVEDGGSEDSTPYDTSESSSASTSSCTPLLSPSSECSRSDTSYKQFIERFCFYTGADSSHSRSPPESLPRSHSTSSIEHYLLSHSPPPSLSSHMRERRFPFESSNSNPPAVSV